MREIKEALRLAHEAGLTERQIAASVRIAAPTVHRYLDRAARAGLAAAQGTGWTPRRECALFPPTLPSRVPRTQPDLIWVHRELRRKGVTLQLLWMEYKVANPGRLPVLPVLLALPAVAGRSIS